MAKYKLPTVHKEALKKLYKENNVGRTVKERLKYWEGTVDSYNISKKVTKGQTVMIFEDCWLFEQFPQDFYENA